MRDSSGPPKGEGQVRVEHRVDSVCGHQAQGLGHDGMPLALALLLGDGHNDHLDSPG
jgi:hypothetical protein